MPDILIVDDDRAALTALAMRLKQREYDVAQASSGRRAVEQYERDRPRAVFLDAALPDMNGFDVCRVIRAADPHHRTKVFFVSGASTPSEEYVSLCVHSSDADGYVRKPYEFSQIAALVEQIPMEPMHAERGCLDQPFQAAATVGGAS